MTHQARYKAYYAERDARRFTEKVKLGLCRSGGCPRKPITGKVLCRRCLAARRAWYLKHPYVRKGYPKTWSPLRRLFHLVGKENRALRVRQAV